jgi:hypothetical protein
MYLPKAVEKLKEKEDVNENFLKYVYPPEWKYINFIGQYNFNDNSNCDLVDNTKLLKEI